MEAVTTAASRAASRISAAQRLPEGAREAILKAATDEFGRHGFSGGRIERIAVAAGYNVRLLYHYFGGKTDLYLAVLGAAHDDQRRQEAALVFDLDDPLGCVDTLLGFTFAYFEDNPHVEGLLRSENLLHGRFLRQVAGVAEDARRRRARLAAVIAAGEARGLFRPGVDPDQLYVTITALSRFHLANALSISDLVGVDTSSPQWRTERLSHASALLRAWISAF